MNPTLVVIPTYNEAPNIRTLVESLMNLDGIDVLVVDDASPDGTADIVVALHRSYGERVRLLSQSKKSGRGSAVLAGFGHGRASGYRSFVEMDSDLSHLPSELTRLLEAGKGADVVIGSRYLRDGAIVGWSWRRRLWSKTSNRLIDAVLHLPISDYTNGYRLYSRAAVEVLLAAKLRERGYISLSEWAVILYKHHFSFANVPTTFVNRVQGKSKMSVAEALGALRGLLRLRRVSSKPS